MKNFGIWRNLQKILWFGEICEISWDLEKWRNLWKSWIWRNGEFCEKSWYLKIFGKNLGIWRTLLKGLGNWWKILRFEVCEKSWDSDKFVKNLLGFGEIWEKFWYLMEKFVCYKSWDLLFFFFFFEILEFERKSCDLCINFGNWQCCLYGASDIVVIAVSILFPFRFPSLKYFYTVSDSGIPFLLLQRACRRSGVKSLLPYRDATNHSRLILNESRKYAGDFRITLFLMLNIKNKMFFAPRAEMWKFFFKNYNI